MKKREKGFSLVEVLVALLVLSIGLLGLAMLQVEGIKFNSSAYLRTQATLLAYDLFDRMRANKPGSDAGAYCLDGAGVAAGDDCTVGPPAVGITCAEAAGGCSTTADLALYDLTRWYDALGQTLPVDADSEATIEREEVAMPIGGPVRRYTVTIRWKEKDLLNEQRWVADI